MTKDCSSDIRSDTIIVKTTNCRRLWRPRHNLSKLRCEKFTTEQLFIACVAANNSTFNTQNSTLPKATIQHSTFNIASATQNPGQFGLCGSRSQCPTISALGYFLCSSLSNVLSARFCASVLVSQGVLPSPARPPIYATPIECRL